MTDPYEIVTKENFDKIKAILEWGISKSKTPDDIAKRISEETGISTTMTRAFVKQEMIGAMEYMNNGNKIT